MRVVNIMSSKQLGGVEQAFLDYNEALALKGNDVFAFYNKRGKIKNRIKQIKNVTYLPSTFFHPTFLLFPIYLISIASIKPDIIIVHSKKILTLFVSIGKLLGIPVIAVCHNEKTKIVNRADYIFSITQYQKDIFIKEGFNKDKIFVIPNCISFNREYKELNNFSNPPIFGIIGRFDPMKGFPIFVEACNILKEKGIDFRAKIAGSPQLQYIEEYKKIKRLVRCACLKDYVEFTGWVDDIDDFYNNIDIFVLPSKYEPFGIVLLEAMSYSKPIISSLAEGPKEIFKDSNAAITFKPGNVGELANKMIEMMNNIDLAKKIAKNGYDLVKSEYSIDVVADKLNNTIEKILEKHNDKSSKR